MHLTRRTALLLAISGLCVSGLSACASRKISQPTAPKQFAGNTPEMQAKIKKWADYHGIPDSLLHRVIKRESSYNPGARNGPYYGLMQILPQTAGQMGYSGPPEGLLDADTNLHYAGRYLRGAWMVANGSEDRAVMWYSKGYYYEAKRRGLLVETGLRS